MNSVVCVIVFVIINYYGLHLLNSPRLFTLKSPFAGQAKLTLTGAECFIILTLGCAPINASIGRYMQLLRMILWMIFIIWGILKTSQDTCNSDTKVSHIIITLYTLLLCYYAIDLLRTPVPLYGFRVLVKYLTPWLILMFIPHVINNEQIVFKSIQVICWIFTAISFYFLTISSYIQYLFFPKSASTLCVKTIKFL